MFKLKELFRINYKNKNIIILLDNQNKKVFLEEKEDGALVCPPIGIFIELYKIYNIKDETLYETKKEKLIKNKSIKRSILEIVKIYAIVIPLTLSSIKINDMFTRENYVYSEQYKILNELYPKKVTKEDVIEVINNNPNLTEEYKKIAKDQLEEFLIKDPAMNLRIYYENMKDIIVDDNVPELLMSLHGEYVVGYYSARDNKIGLLSGVDDKTKMHEFAHAGHCFFLEIGEKVIIINDFSGRSLSEAMNNKMISVTDQEPHSYHNEAYLLDFFMENVDNYNVHSYTEYGNIDDVQALKYSSNTYQFQTAMKVGGGNYVYDGALVIDKGAFDTYRNTFAEYGLGVKTKIDLPNESLGYKGKSRLSGLLLDFSIGQYDTYTPIQISQYMSTIANDGVRIQPHLLKAVFKSSDEPLSEVVTEFKTKELNRVKIDPKYMSRIKEGFKQVLEPGGTGFGYIDAGYRPAGKTGTAQSFIDTNGDGVIDTQTTTATFSGFAPYDNPEVVFTLISPDISPDNVDFKFSTAINYRISKKVSQKYFEIYR